MKKIDGLTVEWNDDADQMVEGWKLEMEWNDESKEHGIHECVNVTAHKTGSGCLKTLMDHAV